MKKNPIFNYLGYVLVPLTTLVLCLIVADIIWRIYEDTGNPFHVWDPEIMNVEPRSSEWTYNTAEFNTHIRTNSRGFRGPEFPEEKEPGTERIVFLGDSMVAAKQVEEEDRFTNLLDERLGDTDVVALGQDGANPIREILFWRAIGKDLDPDIVIQEIYPLNDIVFPTAEAFRIEEGNLAEIFIVKPNSVSKKKTILGSRLIQSLYDAIKRRIAFRVSKEPQETLGLHARHTKEGVAKIEARNVWPTTMAALRTTQMEVEATETRYVIVLIPSAIEVQPQVEETLRNQYRHLADEDDWVIGSVHERMVKELTDAGIPFIDTKPALQEAAKDEIVYFFKDGHINEEGHRIVTDVIVDELNME